MLLYLVLVLQCFPVVTPSLFSFRMKQKEIVYVISGGPKYGGNMDKLFDNPILDIIAFTGKQFNLRRTKFGVLWANAHDIQVVTPMTNNLKKAEKMMIAFLGERPMPKSAELSGLAGSIEYSMHNMFTGSHDSIKVIIALTHWSLQQWDIKQFLNLQCNELAIFVLAFPWPYEKCSFSEIQQAVQFINEQLNSTGELRQDMANCGRNFNVLENFQQLLYSVWPDHENLENWCIFGKNETLSTTNKLLKPTCKGLFCLETPVLVGLLICSIAFAFLLFWFLRQLRRRWLKNHYSGQVGLVHMDDDDYSGTRAFLYPTTEEAQHLIEHGLVPVNHECVTYFTISTEDEDSEPSVHKLSDPQQPNACLTPSPQRQIRRKSSVARIPSTPDIVEGRLHNHMSPRRKVSVFQMEEDGSKSPKPRRKQSEQRSYRRSSPGSTHDKSPRVNRKSRRRSVSQSPSTPDQDAIMHLMDVRKSPRWRKKGAIASDSTKNVSPRRRASAFPSARSKSSISMTTRRPPDIHIDPINPNFTDTEETPSPRRKGGGYFSTKKIASDDLKSPGLKVKSKRSIGSDSFAEDSPPLKFKSHLSDNEKRELSARRASMYPSTRMSPGDRAKTPVMRRKSSVDPELNPGDHHAATNPEITDNDTRNEQHLQKKGSGGSRRKLEKNLEQFDDGQKWVTGANDQTAPMPTLCPKEEDMVESQNFLTSVNLYRQSSAGDFNPLLSPNMSSPIRRKRSYELHKERSPK